MCAVYSVSEKLLARPITEADTDMVVMWRNNPRVVNNFLHREKVTREDHLNWLRTRVEPGIVDQLVVYEAGSGETDAERLESGRPIGCVYLRDIDHDAGNCEYGVFIGEDDCTGHGYGNEIASWAVGYARDHLHLTKMILRVLEGNESAYRSYLRAGFVPVEKIPDYIDGRDLIMMEREL
ncbi:MAG: GNAT family N-acetyltransferase [Lachnospiraceae bacterium]|nr:GNAT family N-acetyltransferase [Lachnospiraceae bacterium]